MPCWIKSDEEMEKEQKGKSGDGRIYDPQAASDAFRQGERIIFATAKDDIETGGPDLLEARRRFEIASENGHALGAAVAGLFWECGIADAKPDYIKAHKYYEESAELGDPLGKCLLASMQFRIEAGSVPGDYKHRKMVLKEVTGIASYGQDPLRWLKEAADKHAFGEAIFLLGSCIEFGVGVKRKDPVTAISLYGKASEMGIKSARRELAKCYLQGRGTEKNFAAAKYWLERTIQDSNDAESMALLSACYERGIFAGLDQVKKPPKKTVEVGEAIQTTNKKNEAAAEESCVTWQSEPEIIERLESSAKTRSENRDFRECFYWAQRSADIGVATGIYQLARCYEQGLGVAVSFEQAVALYEQAARIGSAPAQFALACFCCATESKKDTKRAHELLEKAAESGYTPAMVSLATLYTLQSKCHVKLIESGPVDRFRYNFKTSLLKQRDQLAVTMTMTDEDLKVAMKWWRRAAKRGSAQAQYELALCFRDGRGTEVDLTKALFWMRKAAESGLPEAQLELGVLLVQDLPLVKGATIEHDNESFYWILRAAKNGLPEAQIELAQLFVEGKYVHRNTSTAFYWFKCAAKAGHPFAQYRVGAMLLDNETANGCVSIQDAQSEAVRWLKLASEQGWSDADNLLPIAFGMANEQRA